MHYAAESGDGGVAADILRALTVSYPMTFTPDI